MNARHPFAFCPEPSADPRSFDEAAAEETEIEALEAELAAMTETCDRQVVELYEMDALRAALVECVAAYDAESPAQMRRAVEGARARLRGREVPALVVAPSEFEFNEGE